MFECLIIFFSPTAGQGAGLESRNKWGISVQAEPGAGHLLSLDHTPQTFFMLRREEPFSVDPGRPQSRRSEQVHFRPAQRREEGRGEAVKSLGQDFSSKSCGFSSISLN